MNFYTHRITEYSQGEVRLNKEHSGNSKSIIIIIVRNPDRKKRDLEIKGMILY